MDLTDDDSSSSGLRSPRSRHAEVRGHRQVYDPSDGRSDLATIDDREGSLYINSTISRDDTLSQMSKKQDLLSGMGNQFDDDGLKLNNSNLQPPNHKIGSASFQRSPPPPPPPIYNSRPPGLAMPYYPPGPPGLQIYPPFKASKGAQWRQDMMKRRSSGIESERNMHLDPAGSKVASQPVANVQFEVDPDNDDASLRSSAQDHPTAVSISTPVGGMIAPKDLSDSRQSLENPLVTHQDPISQDQADSNIRSTSNSTVRPGHDNSQLNSGNTITEESISNQKGVTQEPGLAGALSAVAERYLSIDMLDDTQEVSQFIAYLLDTIQMLEGRIRYREAPDAAIRTIQAADGDDDDDNEQPVVPRGQILHQIFCVNPLHKHGGIIYQDEPTCCKHPLHNEVVLEGKSAVYELDRYLDRHPNICFVVIKERICQPESEHSRLSAQDPREGHKRQASKRKEMLRIVSSSLETALVEVAEFQIRPYLIHGNVMEAPYVFLFHHRKRLAALAEQSTYRDVVEPLLEFLSENYEKEYLEAESLFQKAQVTGYHISKLFKPNQMVVSRPSGEALKAYILDVYAIISKDEVNLHGWAWQYSGTELRRSFWTDSIKIAIDEEVPISDLPIHPIEFARKEDIDTLETRGRKFWEMKARTHTRYKGWDKEHDYYYDDARFIVDTETYYLMHPEARPLLEDRGHTPARKKPDPWPNNIGRQEMLPPHAAKLLPATISAFNLLEKKWVSLNVENFHPVDWNKKAFDRLVLDHKTKEMIHALVNAHTSTKKMDDIIAGKGNGLIILLHGSPGTGKTLTAESVAEIAEKPLYRVTCGDIGTDPAGVEKYLQTVMYLGKTWDCVLLLDEADVFLEERTMADLQRNSLVSVFLRILEYYEGILILTSNRVGTFDEAFKSRIQVAIHYDNLTKKSRKTIWQNFLDMLEESNDEDANIPELERRLDELAAEDMNGRQIRNALRTARQLAKHRKERLDWEHLHQVIRTSAEFNRYLRTIKGHSDEQWAREEMLR